MNCGPVGVFLPFTPPYEVDPGSGLRERFEAAWPLISSVKGWLAKEEAFWLFACAAAAPMGSWIVEIGSAMGRSTTALVSGKNAHVPLLAIDPYPAQFDGSSRLRAFCENMDRLGAGLEVQLFQGTSEEAARARTAVFATAAKRAAASTTLTAPASGGPGADSSGREPCHDRVFRLGQTKEYPHKAGSTAEAQVGLLFVDGLHDRHSVLLDIDLWEGLIIEGGVVAFHDAFFRRGVTEALFARHLLNSQFRYERSVVNMSIFRRERGLGTGAVLASGLRLTMHTGHYVRNKATSIAVHRNWGWLQRLFPPLPDFEY
jgi:Methyltransferase domain